MLRFRLLIAALAVSGAVIGLGGCSQGSHMISWQQNGQPYHSHPRQDWWHYQFVFHPASQVYYEPFTHMYYWNDEGMWRQSQQLPQGFWIDGSVARVVKAETPYPPFHHQSALAQAGPIHGGYQAAPSPLASDMLYATVPTSDWY